MDTKKLKICSGCPRTIEANAPDGLCPECLLKAGLGTGVDTGPDSQAEGGQVPFVAPTPEKLVKPFPQLEILGFIGQGGMGAVYKARQKALDRIVARKILPLGILLWQNAHPASNFAIAPIVSNTVQAAPTKPAESAPPKASRQFDWR